MFAHRPAIDAALPGNCRHRQALPLQIQDPHNLPKSDHELPLSTIERSIGEMPPSVFPGHAPGGLRHRKLGNFQTADLGSFTPASTPVSISALRAASRRFWEARILRKAALALMPSPMSFAASLGRLAI
jgi:hypothetical protein